KIAKKTWLLLRNPQTVARAGQPSTGHGEPSIFHGRHKTAWGVLECGNPSPSGILEQRRAGRAQNPKRRRVAALQGVGRRLHGPPSVSGLARGLLFKGGFSRVPRPARRRDMRIATATDCNLNELGCSLSEIPAPDETRGYTRVRVHRD